MADERTVTMTPKELQDLVHREIRGFATKLRGYMMLASRLHPDPVVCRAYLGAAQSTTLTMLRETGRHEEARRYVEAISQMERDAAPEETPEEGVEPDPTLMPPGDMPEA